MGSLKENKEEKVFLPPLNARSGWMPPLCCDITPVQDVPSSNQAESTGSCRAGGCSLVSTNPQQTVWAINPY